MKLFAIKNYSHPPFILIRASMGCSCNCQSCFRSIKNYNKDDIFYGYKNLLKSFIFIEKNFVDDYGILFLGKNFFSFKNIKNLENILKYYKDKSRQIYIQSSYIDIKKNIDYIKKLKYKFTLIYDLNIYSNSELKELLEYITLKDLKINIYIYLEFYKKYYIFLKKLLKKYKKNKDYYLYNTNKIYFINRKEILEREGYLNNLYYSECLVTNNTEIINGQIYLGEGIEITHNGVIKYHMNPYCSRGIKKVSTIDKNKFDIYNDFLTFYKIFLLRNKDKNMGETCYECINNPYSI